MAVVKRPGREHPSSDQEILERLLIATVTHDSWQSFCLVKGNRRPQTRNLSLHGGSLGKWGHYGFQSGFHADLGPSNRPSILDEVNFVQSIHRRALAGGSGPFKSPGA